MIFPRSVTEEALGRLPAALGRKGKYEGFSLGHGAGPRWMRYWKLLDETGCYRTRFKRDYYQCMKDFRAGAGSKYPRNLAYEEKCLEAQGYKLGADTNSNHHEFAKPLP